MTTTLSTQVVGQTEKALNAILDRQLAGTLTEPQWVALTLTVVGGGTAEAGPLSGRVAGVLKITDTAARRLITELAAAKFLTVDDDTVEVTDAGQTLWTETRSAIGQITEGLWGDLPAEDLETAGRVLSTVLTRANALLAEV
jgi:hypothetical protein